ncbi:hypothetical protein N0V82_007057 [Gnomoniopsis sp. IMI 355080]|nr:hypothetical protein N0V82_007057 [Gnomoniopsis sp. IMI 355080]
MASQPNALQNLEEMSQLDKIFKVIEAVKEAINDGVSPQRVEKAVHLLLSKYEPCQSHNEFYGRMPTEEAAAPSISTHIANTDSSSSQSYDTAQHTSNIAAAISQRDANSFVRGLPYDASARDLTNEFLAAAEQAKAESQTRQKCRLVSCVPPSRAARLAFATAQKNKEKKGHNFRTVLTSIAEEDQEDEMVTLNSSDSPAATLEQKAPINAFSGYYCTRAQLGDGDEEITLNREVATEATSLFAQEEKGRKVGTGNTIVVASQPTPDILSTSKQTAGSGKPAAGKKQATTNPPSIKKATSSKKTAKDEKKPTASGKKQVASTKTTAPSADKKPVAVPAAAPTTTVKRRVGRPLGYRKQPNGKFAFPADSKTTPSSESKASCSNGGGKKRKASAAVATGGKPSRKRQHKEPATNESAVEKEVEGSKMMGGGA